MPLAKDLLNPPAEAERTAHKLKRLIQAWTQVQGSAKRWALGYVIPASSGRGGALHAT